MESTTHLYTRNLIDFFHDEKEITDWLQDHWLKEELQHGRTLRRYVEVAWPSFDWEDSYKNFLDEFSAYCSPSALEPTRGMEMVSRCAVEMGTAGYYATLKSMSSEPVLAKLAQHIFEDEIRHYKHFYHYFLRYRDEEHLGRRQIAIASWRRLRMEHGSDSMIALKHAYTSLHPGHRFNAKVYSQLRHRYRELTKGHFPYDLCVKMLLTPLGLPPGIQRVVEPAMKDLARRFVP